MHIAGSIYEFDDSDKEAKNVYGNSEDQNHEAQNSVFTVNAVYKQATPEFYKINFIKRNRSVITNLKRKFSTDWNKKRRKCIKKINLHTENLIIYLKSAININKCRTTG